MPIKAETAVETQWPGDRRRAPKEKITVKKNFGDEVTIVPEIRNDGKRYEGTKQT